jgi:hypothetical protein
LRCLQLQQRRFEHLARLDVLHQVNAMQEEGLTRAIGVTDDFRRLRR